MSDHPQQRDRIQSFAPRTLKRRLFSLLAAEGVTFTEWLNQAMAQAVEQKQQQQQNEDCRYGRE